MYIIIPVQVDLEPGKYVVAVSGGVDSAVLLYALRKLPDVELIVVHFDHGIRQDSKKDRLFVEALASRYGLPFVYGEGALGPNASEAAARKARYDFLRRVQKENAAQGIITAHHQDDVLETAIINLLRGTGRKGLSSLISHKDLQRPLLQIPKSEILAYARENNLQWREDSTNADENYLRNYIRRQILSRFDNKARKQLLTVIKDSTNTNREIDTLLVKYLDIQSDNNTLNRRRFNNLPYELAREVMAAWLRGRGIRDFDSKTLERLVVGAKTGRIGSQFDAMHGRGLQVGNDSLALVSTER
jgi:tRNA(Ile)-lysidine synthetase-like protein